MTGLFQLQITGRRWQAAKTYTAQGLVRRGRPGVKNNIVYILCKDTSFTLYASTSFTNFFLLKL